MRAGIALTPRSFVCTRDRFNDLLGAHESLRRDLALRLSSLAIRYDSQVGGVAPAGGWRMPELELRGAPAPSVFGLLRSARFVLLVISSPGDAAMAVPDLIRPEMVAGYRDHLEVVTAELVGDHPDWAGFGALLIRPDGYVAWSLRRRLASHLARVRHRSSCALCQGAGIIPGVDEIILRTIVIQFEGRVVEVFGNSAEAMRGHVALIREPKIGKPDYRGRSEIHVHGCRFGVDADELSKLLPLLDKITAAVRVAQSARQPR